MANMASSRSHSSILLFLLALIPFTTAQITIDSDAQTTASPSVETISLIDASGIPITTASALDNNAWFIPLTGPASSPTGASWGAQVQYDNDLAEMLPIAFGTTTTTSTSTSTTSTSTPTTATLLSAGSPSSETGTLELELPLPTSNTLLLGKDTTLTITSPNTTNTTTLSTLPVGINLGLANHWNGSLVLGGNYDSNRIYNEPHWQTTPETSSNNSTFITTGLQSLSAVTLNLYTTPNTTTTTSSSSSSELYPFGTSTLQSSTTPLPALLNFTSETITVPSLSWCNRNISIIFNPTEEAYPEFDIPIWGDLIPAGERCVVMDTGVVVLGRPFFQAAYLYVAAEGNVYFSSVTREDRPVVTREFDLHVRLSEAVEGTDMGVNGTGYGYGGGNGTGYGGNGTTAGGKGVVSGAAIGVKGRGWGVLTAVGVVVVVVNGFFTRALNPSHSRRTNLR
ncbi:uncharacterized protein BO80DRAFT_504265 [Aspergillus ibericus CBS 121593]|uniref:Peptidase A1 domain-containing protein n=1 Tax=Aspergillus ibericus CBS 121593 TaxID=1448316 RepID=A0A395GRE7_9EURO|nr:hypothetical protein BO80DRAFT_504265 [Aspergillus ibericus CBS 121593]RAK98140.1 hypothetical protein BO80DRAFT_504265 [Aspergillus ibericus CBS 121593]